MTKISIITISFNQGRFLQACIDSVASQEGPYEHIIVDPGSTDDSRQIIEKNRSHFTHIILEKDSGPSDGLNKGFLKASGNIYCYLNADDIFMPNTLSDVRKFFALNPNIDVISGAGYIIDERGCLGRKVWSDPISRLSLAHGCATLIQPSTFFKSDIFNVTNKFNVLNRSCWDAELWRDMFEAGAKFHNVDRFWSGYRIYGDSITGSGKFRKSIQEYTFSTHIKLLGRKPSIFSYAITLGLRMRRVLRHPQIIWQKFK